MNIVLLKIYLKQGAFSPVGDLADEEGVKRTWYSGLKDNPKCLLQCFSKLKDDCVQYPENKTINETVVKIYS